MSTPNERRIGPWVSHEQLGRGGNGAVFRARRDGDPTDVALKVVNATKPQAEPYRRFVREIEFLQSIGDFPGVLPVLDAYLPETTSKQDRPWLAMPIAMPIRKTLAEASLEQVVGAVASIADTLARLADEYGVGHRDVKPGNLYELDGAFLVGDFGLIDVPDFDELTRSGKPLGPANFTAYEVIQDPKDAASGPADVYSLGKTLWVLATGVNWPPLGHQPADSRGHGIGDHRPHPHAHHLDGLVDRMTRLNADERPSMRQVATDLGAWLRLAQEPVAIDVSAFKNSLRDKLGAEIAAQDLQAERKALALAAVRALQQRVRPLNDALRELHPRAQIDGTDKLSQNTLLTNPAFADVVFSWVRCSTIALGEQMPYALRMGRSLELTADGMLLVKWMLDVGPLKYSGTDFHEYGRDYTAAVGSVEQEELLDRFVEDLRGRLTAALAVFVEQAPDRQR